MAISIGSYLPWGKPGKFILDQSKIEKIHKNELRTLSYYIANGLKHYPSINIKNKDVQKTDYIIIGSFIIDPVLHTIKLVVNIARLPIAILEAFLGLFKVPNCNASNLGNVLAAIAVNIMNIVTSFLVGLTRLFATAALVFRPSVCDQVPFDQVKNTKERNHFRDKLDIFSSKDKYQMAATNEGILSKMTDSIISLTF